MGKIILISVIILSALVLAGCADLATSETLMKNPVVKEFLAQYPNAEVLVIHLTPDTSAGMITELRQLCGNQLEPGDYYRVDITDAASGLMVVALIDTKTNVVECARKTNSAAVQGRASDASSGTAAAAGGASQPVWVPNPTLYPDLNSSRLSHATVLHRKHYDCNGTQVDQMLGFGNEEVIYLKEGPKKGYRNYVCASRYQQQCILDGTFDGYYDEWCEFDDGTDNKPK